MPDDQTAGLPAGPPAGPPAPWWRNTRGEWYVIAQFALFALLLFGPRATAGLPRWSGSAVGPLRWVGAALGVAGLALVAWGIVSLGRNLTAVPHPKADAQLTRSGAYRLVRHPIYSGIIIAGGGWALWQSSWLVVGYAAVLFLFFDVKSRREERWLLAKFPDYAAYRGRVRKLLPFVY